MTAQDIHAIWKQEDEPGRRTLPAGWSGPRRNGLKQGEKERMKIRVASLLILPLVVAVAAMTMMASETSAQPASQTLVAILRGSEEAPGPGDPNGIGAARITLNEAAGEICASIGVAFIETAMMAHIHEGPRGVAGGIVVHLTPLLIPGLSVAQGCVDAEPALIARIAANPSGFYVNVHNAPFPAGAVRGQLR